MTIFRQRNDAPKLLVSRKALVLARLSWLASVLSNYVLPRSPVWIGLVALGVAGATSALVLVKPHCVEAEEVVVSYTVNLRAPTVEMPEEQQAEQPQHEPEPVKADPEPEATPPKPVLALADPEVIVPVEDSMAPAVAAVTSKPECPPVTNNVETVEPAESAPLVAQTPSVAGIPASGGSADSVLSSESGERSNPQSGDSGETLPRYWVSVRDAVARKLVYPYRARSRGVEGHVVISLTLDRKGKVVKAETLPTDVDEDLKMAAVRGIMRAAPFEAPQLAFGENTVTAQVPIQFRLVSGRNTPN